MKLIMYIGINIYNYNITNFNMEDCPPHLLFPDTLNYKIIERYLNRYLTPQEKNLIENYKIEYKFNKKLEKLYDVCDIKNLYVPLLTNLDGNCLFESLVHLGIGTSVQQLRKVISFLFYIYRDYKYFIPNGESTLKELFEVTNEIPYVKCSDGNYYSYTYETMCQDLSNMCAWSKLPTELILMVVSYVFKLEIIILNNVGTYENKINVCKDNTRTIYLGHIQEAHYFPLDYNNDNKDFTYYNTCSNMIKKWVDEMQQQKIKEMNDFYDV